MRLPSGLAGLPYPAWTDTPPERVQRRPDLARVIRPADTSVSMRVLWRATGKARIRRSGIELKRAITRLEAQHSHGDAVMPKPASGKHGVVQAARHRSGFFLRSAVDGRLGWFAGASSARRRAFGVLFKPVAYGV